MNKVWLLLAIVFFAGFSCDDDNSPDKAPVDPEDPADTGFYTGADLSYVNQLADKGAVFTAGGEVKTPYEILADSGANLVRFRLWHDPSWIREVYGSDDTPLYSGLADVIESISLAKAQGLKVMLDFHYSDTWADPGKQYIPEAWKNITDIEVLEDSIYNYTHHVMTQLHSRGLMPEFVQVGNEINCGMLYSEASSEFPDGYVCDGSWGNLGQMLNSAIAAVRDVSDLSTIKTQVVIHVADPVNVQWFFDDLIAKAKVTDFEVIGISYYPLWHTEIRVSGLADALKGFKNRFKKNVMIVETAYPWTTEFADNYSNQFGQAPLGGFDYTPAGQLKMMQRLVSAMKEAGGSGVLYWEPAWISTPNMKDIWGTGSSWENATQFDFEGEVLSSIKWLDQ